MKKEHEILFEPFKIGTVMIKNRFVLEPMEGTNMIDCLPIFKIGEDIYDYYVERAKNHVGLFPEWLLCVVWWGNSGFMSRKKYSKD